MTTVLTIKDKSQWIYYVSNSAEYDFYHTWHYHSLSTDGESILFVYKEESGFVAIPLIKRQIPGSSYYDLSSVYGYSGPISDKKMDKIDDALANNFKAAFLNFLYYGNYVSVFSRMNPFYKQHLLLEKFGSIYDNGQVVVLDLSKSIEEQRENYRRSTKVEINQIRRKGFRVEEGKSPEDIKIFSEIYAENMERKGAKDTYLFDIKHYNELLNSTEYDAHMLMVYDGAVVACCAIVVFLNGIIESYLLSTRAEYLRYSPAKLLVEEITQIGRQLGMRYFNLGGGLGFKKDSLFNWKACFSKSFLDYNSWRFIANPTIYQQLLDENCIDKDKDVDFFPLYRYT